MSRGARSADRGSAIVEFVLVAILVVVIALGLIHLALVLHVRNIAISSASEGARHAALHDQDLADGEARAHDLMASALGGLEPTISGTRETSSGRPIVVIEVIVPMPVLGLVGVGEISVRGRAFEEVDRNEWTP